jgi:hypothetical protein
MGPNQITQKCHRVWNQEQLKKFIKNQASFRWVMPTIETLSKNEIESIVYLNYMAKHKLQKSE